MKSDQLTMGYTGRYYIHQQRRSECLHKIDNLSLTIDFVYAFQAMPRLTCCTCMYNGSEKYLWAK